MPSRFTQYGGVQGADDALRQMVAERIAAQMQAQKQAVEEHKLRQGDIGLGLEAGRLGEDARQFNAAAPQRDANTGYLRAQTTNIANAPVRAADERAQAAMMQQTKQADELAQIQARGNQDARVAGIRGQTAASQVGDKRQWITRDGKTLYLTDAEIQAGDAPTRAGLSTGETAQDRQRIGRFRGAQGFIDGMQALRAKINTKMGPQAGATGYLRRGAASIGMDPDVSVYERLRKAAGRAIAVSILGAQNLSDADAEAYAGMLPDARTDEQTAQRLMQQLESMMSAAAPKEAGVGAQPPGAAPAAPAEFDWVDGKLVPRGQ